MDLSLLEIGSEQDITTGILHNTNDDEMRDIIQNSPGAIDPMLSSQHGDSMRVQDFGKFSSSYVFTDQEDDILDSIKDLF